MSAGPRSVVQLVLACAAVLGCALAWSQVRSYELVEPVLEGQPATTSVVYDPPMLLLTLLSAAAAGVLMVVGVANVRRARQDIIQASSAGSC